jgi:hypothetical protein
LFWLPLGARGNFVAPLSGRVFEWFVARHDRRRPLDLYHSALEVRIPEGRWVIETAAVIHDEEGASRGVVLEGRTLLSESHPVEAKRRCPRDEALNPR